MHGRAHYVPRLLLCPGSFHTELDQRPTLCWRKQIRSIEGIHVQWYSPEEKMQLQEVARTCSNKGHSIIPQLMVTDELRNAALPQFPRNKTTQCFHFYVSECLANFDPYFSSHTQEDKSMDFVLKEWHTLYYDHRDTDSTAGHSLTSKALLLSSFCHHLGLLGNIAMEKILSPPCRHWGTNNIQAECPGMKHKFFWSYTKQSLLINKQAWDCQLCTSSPC